MSIYFVLIFGINPWNELNVSAEFLNAQNTAIALFKSDVFGIVEYDFSLDFKLLFNLLIIIVIYNKKFLKIALLFS